MSDKAAKDGANDGGAEKKSKGKLGLILIGVGMLVLGIPLMLLCAIGNKNFFQGKTLDANTEVKVPDVY